MRTTHLGDDTGLGALDGLEDGEDLSELLNSVCVELGLEVLALQNDE